jgi:adenylate cyclase
MAGLQRSRRQFVRGALLAAAASAALVLLLAPTAAFRWLETGTYDARARYAAGSSPADPRIVIIDIDSSSFDNLKDVLGRWPWTRAVYTAIIWHAQKGHARVIAFDSIWEGAESAEVDSDLAAQISRAGNVVLGYTFSEGEGITDHPYVARDWSLITREAAIVGPNAVGEPTERSRYLVNAPLPELASSAAGLGSVGSVLDSDGIVRSLPLAHRFGDRSVPSLAVRIAAMVSNAPVPIAFVGDGRGYASAGRMRVPVDEHGRLRLAWRNGASQAYERIPFWMVLCSIEKDKCPPSEHSYPANYFRDKIVIVAASAIGAYELRPTPLDEFAPGFVAHATAIDNLLHNDGIHLAPRWFLPIAVVLLAAGSATILVFIAGSARGTLVAVLLAAAYTSATFTSFSHWHLWLPLAGPLVALALSFASSSVVRYATTGRELRRTRGTLDRYLAPQLVEYVLDHLDDIEFGGEKRDLTILFSDVRNFTTLTEASDPLQLISQLNDYLNAMTDVIFRYHGVVDKFIGDGILAHWGAFNPGQNHAELAARAALEMFDRLAELNVRWKEKGLPQLDIGVGINTGEVVFGNVGAGKKIEFTVIGDPVNLAARLESLNKEFKTHIIISEFTLARLGEMAQVRSLGGVKVKGKTIETAIYELTGLGQAGAAPPAKAASGAAQAVSARADD